MSELAAFLRARREQLSPADVGLRSTGRRRTPGLRREELATLAGVSIDYLVRLEQGRDSHPSAAVIAALADALLLSEVEKRHLYHLALIEQSTEMCPSVTVADVEVPDTVRSLLQRLEPTPAFVVGAFGDVLAANPSWELLAGPMGIVEGDAPNLLRFTFTNPSARAVHRDWAAAADEEVGQLRAAWLRWALDPALAALVAELEAVPEFATRWTSHALAERPRRTQILDHPTLGELRITAEVLVFPGDAEQRLVTWLPADAATEQVLEATARGAVATSPPHLRVVGEA